MTTKKPSLSKKKTASGAPRFDGLVLSICEIHQQANVLATRAVNISLTLRNWLIGHRIEVYERMGADRAKYGDRLMDALATALVSRGFGRCDRRELYRYRQFYMAYPRIVESLTPQFGKFVGAALSEGLIVETPSPQSKIPGKMLVERLSFSHLAELIQLADPTQRAFYEVECVRGTWSVRELKRQIASLYYERSGLSKDKKKLSNLAHAKAEAITPAQVIRDPYLFEFLGLKAQEVMGESDLEDALLDKLQSFMLELGHGFCFEARQKRILIGGEQFFVDLVFYHRILKCHVLVELKTKAFSHENLGQLNAYVGYYKKHQMTPGDNPPVGILLCTKKNHPLVEFALGGMANKLFVSRYAVEMPKKEEMERFIGDAMKEVGQ